MTKNLILWLVIATVLFMVFQNFTDTAPKNQVPYSEFVHQIEEGRVLRVEVDEANYFVETVDGSFYSVVKPPLPDLDILPLMTDNRVEVEGKELGQTSLWQQLLVASFPILLFIAVFIFFMRQMQGGGGWPWWPHEFCQE